MIAANRARDGAGERSSIIVDAGLDFESLYVTEHDQLVRFAGLVAGSTVLAEDLAQDAFAKLYSRFGRIENPAAWLRTVVANSAKNEFRRSAVRRRFLERHGPLHGGVATDRSANELIESLRTLPARQRAVIVLRFYEDRPEAEIAAILGVRLGSVKSSLHRSLTALRQEIPYE